MIGMGVATLESTTALAGNGRAVAARDQGGDEFARTLDQASKRGSGAKDASETDTRPSPESVSQRRGMIAETGWSRTARHSAAETGELAQGEAADPETVASDDAAEADGDARLREKTQDDRSRVVAEASGIPETRGGIDTGAGDESEAALDAGEAVSKSEGPATDVEPPQARAGAESANGEVRPEKDARRLPLPSNDDGAAGNPLNAADEAAPDARAAGPMVGAPQAAVSARADVGSAASNPPADRAVARRMPLRADGKPAADKGGAIAGPDVATPQSERPKAGQGERAGTRGEASRVAAQRHTAGQDATVRTGSSETTAPVAPGKDLAAEPRATREVAPAADRGANAKPVVRAHADGTAHASPAAGAAERPPLAVSGAQSAQAAPGTTATPASQVAEAVSRDLAELAPSRIALSGTGAPNRPLRSMQLQLNPAELGSVNVRLQSAEGELRVSIRAESEETARMLSRDSETIRSALRAAGISAQEITVTVNRNDTATQQFAGQNRDAPGQQAAPDDNRGTMSNDSKNPNRNGSSGDAHSPFSRGDVHPGDGNRDSRIFI